MATESKTFCDRSGLMSCCAQKNDSKEQEKCAYYEKASRLNRCMFLTFKKFCTSVDAQYNTKII